MLAAFPSGSKRFNWLAPRAIIQYRPAVCAKHRRSVEPPHLPFVSEKNGDSWSDKRPQTLDQIPSRLKKKCRKWSLEACQILAYVDYFFSGKWRVPTSPIIQKPFVFYSSTKFIQIVPKWQLAVKSSGLFCTATLHLATAEENWLMTTDICTSLFQLGPCCDATSSVQACSTEVGQSCICSH